MTAPLDDALSYTQRGWPVFPCQWRGERRKQPLVPAPGLHLATRDPAQIDAWWRKWPDALIAVPTGKANGFNVLDVDCKDPSACGFDTLDELGFSILPETRIVHTGTCGLHLHFAPGEHAIRNTAGKKGRGIGPGLDWRGEGGYVIVPSDGSGYSWDPVYGIDTPVAAIPPALLPRAPERALTAKPVETADGLSPYARAALNSACRNIVDAANGEQESTLNSECLAIGSLAGSGAIPLGFALRTLQWAASQIPNYDPRRPWRDQPLKDKVKRAFDAGLSRPREVRRHA